MQSSITVSVSSQIAESHVLDPCIWYRNIVLVPFFPHAPLYVHNGKHVNGIAFKMDNIYSRAACSK